MDEEDQPLSATTLKEIDDTVAAEDAYRDFVDEERHRRHAGSDRSEPRFQPNPYEATRSARNPDLSQFRHARVVKVELRSNDTFRITIEDRPGQRFVERLPATLPEDTGSEWVRLCRYVGADPGHPATLRGKVVPIRRHPHRSSVTLDIPPVYRRLNRLRYRTSRLRYRLGIGFRTRTMTGRFGHPETKLRSFSNAQTGRLITETGLIMAGCFLVAAGLFAGILSALTIAPPVIFDAILIVGLIGVMLSLYYGVSAGLIALLGVVLLVTRFHHRYGGRIREALFPTH